MDPRLLEWLACPACRAALRAEATARDAEGRITSGRLTCTSCAQAFPIRDGIPRFVEDDGYAESFGLQWTKFQAEQMDSANRFSLSAERFYAETGWPKDWLAGRRVLDAGCGAGRFLDVAAAAGAEVIGVDLSRSVDAARANLARRPNVHLVQASLYALPFRDRVFDGCYCLGVLQHTPDPAAALRALPRLVRDGGRLGFFIYERKPWTMLYSKYWLRPLTRRLPPRVLLAAIQAAMPALFLLTEVLFRVPVLGRVFRFLIPVSNYVGSNVWTNQGLTWRQRYQWAVMDTFDMLAPRYDQPQREADVRRVLQDADVTDVRRTAAYGLCLQGTKRPAAAPAPVEAAA